MAVVGSPFTSSATPERLPDRRVSHRGSVTIRAVGGAVDIRADPDHLVNANKKDHTLLAGESITIDGDTLTSLSDISIMGAATIYWGVT